MFKNYFKIAFRNLWRNKTYNFLNIAGLALGIASAALIFLWVENETTYNHNFEKRDYLYKVYENQTHDNVSTFLATSGPIAAGLKAEIPGIKNTARLSFNQQLRIVFGAGEKTFNEQGYYADSSIFSMLDLPFVHGNAANAFMQLHSVVVSENMAKKFFGADNPVGKTLKVNDEQDYIVTGVFKDLPQNSTLQFQWLAPFEIFESTRSWLSGWGNNGVTTLAELEPTANVAAINQKLKGYINTKQPGNNTECFLYPMNRWNLYNHFTNGKEDNEGEIKYINLFSLIAITILIIACINFMNLATARSEQRAKEVGVHKVMGAKRIKLINRFIAESLLMSFLAVLLAIGIIYLALPFFNTLIGKELSLNLFSPLHIGCLILVGLITGLLAGSYPAFYLSSFNPTHVLKGLKISSNNIVGFIRQGLVVSQFTASIILIISTIVIYRQIQHVKERELGYNKNNSIYLDLQGQLHDRFNIIHDELVQTGAVQNVALSEYPSYSIWNSTDNFSWQGKDLKSNSLFTYENVTPQFLSTMGMKLIAGRDFYTIPKVDSNNVLINEALAKLMGKEGRIGGTISAWGNQFNVVGIIKDFVYNDMYAASGPFAAFCKPENVGSGCLTILFNSNANISDALSKVETIIKQNNPDYPFEYKFVDEEFNKLFTTETLIGQLANVFAALAIFISCLGLFGLAAYTAEKRTKEIGIRKVLGASISGITALLSKDFIKLVCISCLVAFPAAWFAMNKWLQNYQYRIEISWWIFLAAGISAILIALITISFQSIKAAIANPVKSLRAE